MVFAGCSRIKSQFNNIKEEAKSKISKKQILTPGSKSHYLKSYLTALNIKMERIFKKVA